MESRLTKDAEKLLCVLYKDYLEKRKSGVPRGEANYFSDSDYIQDKFLPNWTSDDVSDLCWEMHRAGVLRCTPGDNLANNVTLTPDAIARMENRFKDNVKEIAEFIGNFIP